MNEQERAELEQLKTRQAALVKELTELGVRLGDLEKRIAGPETVPPLSARLALLREITAPSAAAPPTVPPPIPPPIKPAPPPVSAPPEIKISRPEPSPIPPLVSVKAKIEEAKTPPLQIPSQAVPPPPIAPRTAAEPASAAAPGAKSSFEMRLGTYWLVRIGIVMLLTGLVFFATFAYQNYVGRIGPAGKITLLYLASGILLGVGTWLQRKQESLRNYAQVLQAGGLAAVYFTTYAAHHIPQLLVIQSPLLDGGLLFGWAGFVVWVADRKKSEVLALFAVLLAYYTSIITHAGLFTLYSNLLLTAAAVFFLVRNRWATLSFASLVATYVSYAFWRFYQNGEWQWATPEEGLWTGTYFLIGYWLLFTVAVFLSKHEQFEGGRRVSFLSLNNAAFFSAFILTMLQVHHGGFWKFSLAYGAALLALSAAARRFLAQDRLFSNAYLTQGLLLATLGFITYYEGLWLSLVLAIESVILVTLGREMKSRVMQAASLVAAALATGWCVSTLEEFDRHGLVIGGTVGALMLFNAFWLRRETTFEHSAIHLRTLFYTVLGLAAWLFVTWQNTKPEWRGLALAGECAVMLLAARPLGNRAMLFGAYAFAGVAVAWQVYTLGEEFDLHELQQRVGLWPGIVVGALMILGALWEQRFVPAGKPGGFHPPTSGLSFAGLLTWAVVTGVFTSREYLAPMLAVEAICFTAAHYPLRLKELALFGQLFPLLAQVLWLNDAAGGHVLRPWWNPAIVIAVTLGLAAWWQRQKTLVFEQPIGTWLQGIFALAVVGLMYFWLEPHFSPPAWLAFTSLLALLLTAYGAVNRYWLLAAAGQLFLLVSGWQFGRQLLEGKPEWYLPLAPMAVLCLMSFSAIKWFERRPEARAEVRTPILQIGQAYRVVALVMSLWWVHKYVPAREHCWALALPGLVLFLVAGWRRNQELLLFSAVYSATSLARFWLPMEDAPTVYLPNLAAILAVLAQQQIAKRASDQYRVPAEVPGGVIILGGLSLWLLVSRWILKQPDGLYLTAGWSGLALVLFIAGMALRERVYRWLGLGILACALGRVVIFDVWKLETIYRILSFMALGIVLLVLGFLYNKYQEKIKEWL